jgi:hypothetical protein
MMVDEGEDEAVQEAATAAESLPAEEPPAA